MKTFFILYYRGRYALFDNYMRGARLLYDWLRPTLSNLPPTPIKEYASPLDGYEIQELANITGLSQAQVRYFSAEAAVECFIWDTEHS